MRERKNSEDDYNKTQHVYADPRKLVQEIKRERGLSRQDSKKTLNVDTQPTARSKKDAKKVKGSKAISKPKSSSPSEVAASSTLPPESSKSLSHTIVPPKSPLTYSNDSSALLASNTEFNSEHEKSDPLISNVLNSTLTETQLKESINSNENTDAKLTVSKADTTEPSNSSSPQLQPGDVTKSTTPTLFSSLLPQPSADTEANETLSADQLVQSTSESRSSPSAVTQLERSSSPIIKKESPYAELPPRKDVRDENVQEKAAPPEPPPPRTSNGESTLNSKLLKSKASSGDVELGLRNVEVISTSSSTKHIDNMVRRRRRRRVFLILISAFLFCLLLGVAGVAIYLISLGRTDNEETALQTSNQGNN